MKYMLQFVRTMKKAFIPHKGNDYQPHIFRKHGFLFAFLVLAALYGLSQLHLSVVSRQLDQLAAVLPSVLIDETNEERREEGMQELRVSPVLEQAALLKAQDMASKEYFAHYTPDGRTPWDFFRDVGYSYIYAGENLAVNFKYSSSVTRAWMNSPSHRANILNDNFTEIGIAAAEGEYKGRRTLYVAQLFGTPYESPVDQEVGDVVDQVAAPTYASFTERLRANPLLVYQGIILAVGVIILLSLLSVLLRNPRGKRREMIVYALLLLFAVAGFWQLMQVESTGESEVEITAITR